MRAAIAELDDDPELLRQERERARWLFVDEYQDTDPAQVELLAGCSPAAAATWSPSATPTRPSTPSAAPSRAASSSSPSASGTPTAGRPAGSSLGVCRRSGEELLAAQPEGRRGAARAAGSTGAWPRGEAPTPGAAEVHVFGSAAVEAAYLADVLRRAHLLDRVPWSRMAVVVRTARALGPAAPRAGLGRRPGRGVGRRPAAAGQPAVAPLLKALSALLPASAAGPRPRASRSGSTSRPRRRCSPPRSAARPCSTSAACGGPSGSRWPSRASTPPSAARRWPSRWATTPCSTRCPSTWPAPARRVADVLAAGRLALAQDGTAEDVLWAMWQRSGLADRWARASAAGGPSGAVADRDLDAVVALFDAAAGFVDRLPSADVRAFVAHLSAQELPGDTGAARAVAGETVRLLTAHAAKGLEWDLVCVAGVQEGVWPDLRERTSLLGIEELVERASGIDGTGVDRRTLALAEERRLFYVACTRARRAAGRHRRRGCPGRRRRRRDRLPLPRPGRAARRRTAARSPSCPAR